MYRDIPGSELPDYSVADAFNMLLYGDWAEVRPGTRLWAEADLPTLAEDWVFSAGGAPISPLPDIPGRSGYSASKSGHIITAVSGADFISTDLYKYFVWPDGIRDVIIEVIAFDQIRVKSDETHADCTTGKIQGRINQRIWHDESRLTFFHIDTRVFYTDWRMNNFTEVMNASGVEPADEKSSMDEYDGFVYLFTTNGIFKIDHKEDVIQMVWINSSIPEADYAALAKSSFNNIARRYVNTMAVLTGEGVRNRGTPDVRIIKESGPNPVRRDTGDYDDFVDCYYVTPPRQTDGNQIGYWPSLGAMAKRLDQWLELTDGSFAVQVNATHQFDVMCNFTAAETWEGIAAEIQKQIRQTFAQYAPNAICKYADQLFYIFAGPDDGNAVTNVLGPAAGTDISGAAWLNMAGGGVAYISSGHIIGRHGYTANGDGNINQGLEPPSNTQQWTHYVMYGSKTVTVPGNESLTATLAGQQGVTIDQMAWLDDVPVAKAFTCEMVNGVVTATKGTFERMDVGSRLRFLSGKEYEIRVYNSPTQVMVLYGAAVGWNEPSSAANIGEGRVMSASQSGTTVTRQNGDKFEASDIGKLIFWADGGYGHIREWTNSNTVEVWESAERDNQGITLDPTRRCYNDTIIDDPVPGQIQAVESRFKALPLRNRFHTPLPSTRLGTINNGFMFVGAKNGEVIHYSQAPVDYEYLVGHHFLEFQKHPVKDSIQAIKEFQERIIIYCSLSTHYIPTSSLTLTKVPEVGEVIATIRGVYEIDPDTGIKDQSCIQRIEGGAQIVMTSKGAIKVFDGHKYGDNLAVDKEGKGYIQRDINLMQPVVAVGYNEIYGYMIWGSTDDQINNTVVDLNVCYKLGIKSEHSQGWCELGGAGWVIPEPGIGAFQVFNDKDQAFMIVMDARRGLPYLIATKQGPEGSDIYKVWRDRVGLQYDAGYEIPWRIRLKEHRGAREDDLLKHLDSHAFLRPQFEDRKSTSGHNQWGYRSAQEVTLTGYQNGNVVSSVQSRDLPDRADIAFDKQFKDNRLQFELSGTASELRLVRFTTDYEQKDQRGKPESRFMSEHLWQEELSHPLFWVCREVTTNIADGSDPTGSIFGFGTGPDEEESAMIFVAASTLTYTFTDILSGDFSLMFGFRAINTNTEIITIGNASVTIRVSAGVYTMRFNDGNRNYDQELGWGGSGWAMLKLTRSDDRLIISEDGEQLMIMLLDTIETLSGNIVFNAGNAKQLFCPWLFDTVITEDAFNYHYRDTMESQGEALLCPV